MPKNAFTKGPVEVLGELKYSVWEMKGDFAQNWIGDLRDERHAQFVKSAFNSATTCSEMGYDGQKCVELLPEIIKRLEALHQGCNCLDSQEYYLTTKLLEKAKG